MMEIPKAKDLLTEAESIKNTQLNTNCKSQCHAVFMVGAAVTAQLTRVADCLEYFKSSAEKEIEMLRDELRKQEEKQ
jgi:hypothetical protein